MTEAELIGSWSLVSSTQSRNDVVSGSFGDPPGGQLQYTADGRMSAFLMSPEWPATGENATRQADMFFSYAGRWEIEGNRIYHFIEFCSAPSKIGISFVRDCRFLAEDRMELTTIPETSPSGNVYVTTLVWQRNYSDDAGRGAALSKSG